MGTVVAGQVRSSEGDPIVEARAYFARAPVSLPDIAALTDADGRFSLFAPVPGRYQIECSADHFVSATATLEISDKESEIDVVVELVRSSEERSL